MLIRIKSYLSCGFIADPDKVHKLWLSQRTDSKRFRTRVVAASQFDVFQTVKSLSVDIYLRFL